MIKIDSKPETRVVLLTVSMVALAGLIVGIASYVHTQRIVGSYNDAMQKELQQKGLAYGQTTQSLLNLVATTSPESFQALLARAASDPGSTLSSQYTAGERGDFGNPPLGYEVWAQDTSADSGYTLMFRRDNPAERGTTPGDPDVASVVAETAATGEPTTKIDSETKDLNYSVALQLNATTRLIVVVTLDATEEFNFFAHQRESAVRNSILLALASITFVSLIGGTISIVLARNLTNRKLAEDALRDSELRYRALAELSPVGIFRTDTEGNNLYSNQRTLEALGVTSDPAKGWGWMNGIHPEDRDRVIAEWKEAQANGTQLTSQCRFLRPDGSTVWVLGQVAPERNLSGEIVGYVGTVTDITEQKRLEEALREEARRDRLTGALNHGAIIEIMGSLISSAPNERFSVAMIDIDNMKSLNDTYGHPIGDLAIQAVARALDQPDTVVGRYGGDEFVALLPGADRPAAEAYMRSVAASLARADLTDSDTGAAIAVTATIGLSVYPAEAESSVDLIKLADNAMYARRRRRLGDRREAA